MFETVFLMLFCYVYSFMSEKDTFSKTHFSIYTSMLEKGITDIYFWILSGIKFIISAVLFCWIADKSAVKA